MYMNTTFTSNMLKSILGKGLKLSYCSVLVFVFLLTLFSGCSNEKSVQPQNVDQGDFLSRVGPWNIDPGDSIPSIEPQNPDEGSFRIRAKYTWIRSYPTGGGIFIVRLLSENDFSGNVYLSINAHPSLNARLDRNVLNRRSNIAEITIHPSQSAEIRTHIIELKATHSVRPTHIVNDPQIILLEVEIINCGPGNISTAMEKRDEFISWLEAEHTELGNFSDRRWFAYMTYPGILVVEHWTFLDSEWEMRICYHVMIPPYDWSMLLLRERGEWDPVFAAKRESDGTIYEIPVSDYPIMFLY